MWFGETALLLVLLKNGHQRWNDANGHSGCNGRSQDDTMLGILHHHASSDTAGFLFKDGRHVIQLTTFFLHTVQLFFSLHDCGNVGLHQFGRSFQTFRQTCHFAQIGDFLHALQQDGGKGGLTGQCATGSPGGIPGTRHGSQTHHFFQKGLDIRQLRRIVGGFPSGGFRIVDGGKDPNQGFVLVLVGRRQGIGRRIPVVLGRVFIDVKLDALEFGSPLWWGLVRR